MVKNDYPILNIFEKNLKRGSERLAFDPQKRYAYVEHPLYKWRIYLRSAAFIYIIDSNASEKTKKQDQSKFVIVKTAKVNSWEMPKGQMEGKDINLRDSILSLLYRNVKREIFEESGLKGIKNLKYTGKVFQGVEKNYPSNTFFQYHIFKGFITKEQFDKAKERFEWLKENPDKFDELTRDKKEKDAIDINSDKTPFRKGWGRKIANLYLESVKKSAKQTKKNMTQRKKSNKRKTIRKH
jgi:hypothetical protein